jgi:hypothetical protein
MKTQLRRFGLIGLAASCLTVWGSYFYFLASVSA